MKIHIHQKVHLENDWIDCTGSPRLGKWPIEVTLDKKSKGQSSTRPGHKGAWGWYESGHSLLVFMTTAHKGMMWLAPCPAALGSLLCMVGHPSWLDWWRTRNRKPQLKIRTGMVLYSALLMLAVMSHHHALFILDDRYFICKFCDLHRSKSL